MLLIEAGPDDPGITDADRLTDQMEFQSTLTGWGIDATFVSGATTLNYPQGRKTGGGSAVNGAFAVRGVRDDYERWAAAAGDEWSWPHMLRVLCRLESDQDFGGESHGTDGPIPVVRWRRDELLPQQQGFLTAVMDHGIPWVDDLNAPDASGIGPMPMNRRDGVRMSTALTLPPARPRAREPDDLARHRGDARSARARPRYRGRVPARRNAGTGARVARHPLLRRAAVADAAAALRHRPGWPPRRRRRRLRRRAPRRRREPDGPPGHRRVPRAARRPRPARRPRVPARRAVLVVDRATRRTTCGSACGPRGSSPRSPICAPRSASRRSARSSSVCTTRCRAGTVRLRSTDPAVRPQVDFRMLSRAGRPAAPRRGTAARHGPRREPRVRVDVLGHRVARPRDA